MSTLRRAVAALGVALTVSVAIAPTAGAHGVAGDDAPASNYRSTVTDTPSIDGVSVRMIDAGSQLELVNLGDDEVVVLDYDGQPYLRIGPDGVLENRNSPAAYLNQSSDASVTPPDGIGDGAPVWLRVSGERSFRWHDHRAHWMGGDPPLVVARPDQLQTVAEWTVPLRVGDRRVEVTGVTDWVPAPPSAPWLLLLVALAAAIAALALRGRIVTAIGLSTLVIGSASIAIVVGSWQSSAESALGKAPMLALPFLVISVLVGALMTARTRPQDAMVLAAGAGATVALTTTLSSADWLTRSQLPTALPPVAARLVVSVSIGAGAGLAVAAAWTALAPLLRRGAAAGTAPTSSDVAASEPVVVADEYPIESPVMALSGSTHMRRVILAGFVATLIAVGAIGQATLDNGPAGGADDASGLGEICRAVDAAPTDDGVSLRAAFAGPPHDALHELAARLESADRSAAGDLLRAKQRIEAALSDPDTELEPGSELALEIRRATDLLDEPVPDACTLEPS